MFASVIVWSDDPKYSIPLRYYVCKGMGASCGNHKVIKKLPEQIEALRYAAKVFNSYFIQGDKSCV